VPLSKEKAAHALGVPEREVLDVADHDDGHKVTTSDGVAYHVTEDGEVSYLANYPKDTLFPVRASEPPPPAELLGQEEGAEDQVAPGLEDDETVPDGPVGTVLAWVNRDQARAARALRAERDRDEPRQTLVAQLERLAQP
jgi:hypothetical protein